MLPEVQQESTIIEEVKAGNIDSLLKLITPTHIGIRTEAFVCFGICIGGGDNLIQNFEDNRAAVSVDTFGGTGPELGGKFVPKLGFFASVGPIIGWASSSIEDSTSGNALQISGFAAGGLGMTASVNTPINLEGDGPLLNGDPKYGQSPVTMYLGFGSGIGLGLGYSFVHTLMSDDIK